MKIRLYWSKKENDWMMYYPDLAGKSLLGVFFEMLKVEENISFLKYEPRIENGERVLRENPQDLKQLLTERGYDYRTLKITCEKIKTDNEINK